MNQVDFWKNLAEMVHGMGASAVTLPAAGDVMRKMCGFKLIV